MLLPLKPLYAVCSHVVLWPAPFLLLWNRAIRSLLRDCQSRSQVGPLLWHRITSHKFKCHLNSLAEASPSCHWIGLREIYRKPWFLPSNIGVSCKISHHPILCLLIFQGFLSQKAIRCQIFPLDKYVLSFLQSVTSIKVWLLLHSRRWHKIQLDGWLFGWRNSSPTSCPAVGLNPLRPCFLQSQSTPDASHLATSTFSAASRAPALQPFEACIFVRAFDEIFRCSCFLQGSSEFAEGFSCFSLWKEWSKQLRPLLFTTWAKSWISENQK